MKGTVQGALRGTLKNAQEQIDAKVKADRETMRKNERDQKEVIRNAKAKARERPLLIDSYNSKKNSNLAKIQNLKKFAEIMKESGMKQKDIDARMTEEEKELLAEEKFIEKAYLGEKELFVAPLRLTKKQGSSFNVYDI